MEINGKEYTSKTEIHVRINEINGAMKEMRRIKIEKTQYAKLAWERATLMRLAVRDL